MGLKAIDPVRRAEIRNSRIEDLRARQKTGHYLSQIEAISRILQFRWTELNKDQIAALRLRADIQFRRLAKVFPDLKSVDITSAGDKINQVGIALIQQPPTKEAWIEAATGRVIEYDDDDDAPT